MSSRNKSKKSCLQDGFVKDFIVVILFHRLERWVLKTNPQLFTCEDRYSWCFILPFPWQPYWGILQPSFLSSYADLPCVPCRSLLLSIIILLNSRTFPDHSFRLCNYLLLLSSLLPDIPYRESSRRFVICISLQSNG